MKHKQLVKLHSSCLKRRRCLCGFHRFHCFLPLCKNVLAGWIVYITFMKRVSSVKALQHSGLNYLIITWTSTFVHQHGPTKLFTTALNIRLHSSYEYKWNTDIVALCLMSYDKRNTCKTEVLSDVQTLHAQNWPENRLDGHNFQGTTCTFSLNIS